MFPDLGRTFWPKKGAAVFWYNLYKNGEGDVRTRHAACPVLAGTKWGMYFLFLPFFPTKSGIVGVFLSFRLLFWPFSTIFGFFYNLYKTGEGDVRTRHAACPVLAGTKWGIYFLFLPFFPTKSGIVGVFSPFRLLFWPLSTIFGFFYNLLKNGEGDLRIRHAACLFLAGTKWSK